MVIKDPRDLIRDFRDGKTEGIHKITVRLETHQSAYTAREDHLPVRGLDKLVWTDEYEIEITPVPPKRRDKPNNMFWTQIKRGYAYRHLSPYGYQDESMDIFMQTQQNEDGSISPIEEPQIPKLRIASPIKEIMDEAKADGAMDYDAYKERYGSGGEKDEVAGALFDLQHGQLSRARERIGLIRGADLLLQQFLMRVKNGPKNLSQTVYVSFTPPGRDTDSADSET